MVLAEKKEKRMTASAAARLDRGEGGGGDISVGAERLAYPDLLASATEDSAQFVILTARNLILAVGP